MPEGGLVVGVDVGGTKIHAVAVDPTDPAAVVDERRVPTPAGSDALVAAIRSVVAALSSAPVAVGLGMAGLVDRAGVLRYGPNLPGALDVDLPGRLGDLAAAVVVENDNTCAGWAEFRTGAGAGVRDMVFVGLGTGLGVGLVVDGRVVVGASGFAGESGHMIVDPDGVVCVCGRRGCWERYASGAALARYGEELVEAGRGQTIAELAALDDSTVRGEHVAAAHLAGDPDAEEAVDRLARWTALGVANLIGTVDPAVVVLGGGVLEDLGEDLCRRVAVAVPGFLMGAGHRPAVPVVPARLGGSAAALGAALLALDATVAG